MRLLTPQGNILVQTAYQDQPAIEMALKNDYVGFYNSELKVREDTGYPPYTKLAKLTWVKQTEPPTLDLSDKVSLFGPFQSKFLYFIVRGRDLIELNKLRRPWKVDIDPTSL
jgi:primosomal protein N'